MDRMYGGLLVKKVYGSHFEGVGSYAQGRVL